MTRWPVHVWFLVKASKWLDDPPKDRDRDRRGKDRDRSREKALGTIGWSHLPSVGYQWYRAMNLHPSPSWIVMVIVEIRIAVTFQGYVWTRMDKVSPCSCCQGCKLGILLWAAWAVIGLGFMPTVATIHWKLGFLATIFDVPAAISHNV